MGRETFIKWTGKLMKSYCMKTLQTYKKKDKKKVRAIDIDPKKIGKDLELEDRIEDRR